MSFCFFTMITLWLAKKPNTLQNIPNGNIIMFASLTNNFLTKHLQKYLTTQRKLKCLKCDTKFWN